MGIGRSSLVKARFSTHWLSTHLTEMICGESCLVLKLVQSGTKTHFNAFDALFDWKHEALPPVEVPAAAQWKFRSFSNSFGANPVTPRERCWREGTFQVLSAVSIQSLSVRLFACAYAAFACFYFNTCTRECYRPLTNENPFNGLYVMVAMVQKGYPTGSASYCEPNIFSQKLPVIMHRIQRLIFCNNL
ncbi:hypothetical protein GQ457_10G020460 [Hibiscus cannabinus]